MASSGRGEYERKIWTASPRRRYNQFHAARRSVCRNPWHAPLIASLRIRQSSSTLDTIACVGISLWSKGLAFSSRVRILPPLLLPKLDLLLSDCARTRRELLRGRN